MTEPFIDGHFIFLDYEPQSMLDLTASKDERQKEVQGTVKRIDFKGKVELAEGHWAESIGITYSWTLARDCYTIGLFAGTIQFASTAVECAINHDARMQPVKKEQFEKQTKRPSASDRLVNVKSA